MVSTVTKDTVIPISLAVSVVTAVVLGAWSVRGHLADLDKETALRFERIESQLESMRVLISTGFTDRWRRTDMIDLWARFRTLNPTLPLPEVPPVK